MFFAAAAKRVMLIVLFLGLCGVNAFSQASAPSADEPVQEIEALLKAHANRQMGNGMVSWTTRLEKFDNCRMELRVHTTMHTKETWEEDELVSFPVGALQEVTLTPDLHSFELDCRNREKCLVSFVSCSRTRADGISTDCSNQTRADSKRFSIQDKRDAGDNFGENILQAFHRTIETCRTRQSVSF